MCITRDTKNKGMLVVLLISLLLAFAVYTDSKCQALAEYSALGNRGGPTASPRRMALGSSLQARYPLAYQLYTYLLFVVPLLFNFGMERRYCFSNHRSAEYCK